MINISHVAGYEYTAAILSEQTGESIYVHPVENTGGEITCTLIAGASTGKFQVSTSPKANIEAGTATWKDWANGTQTGTISDSIESPVTAVRGVSVSGAIVIEIVI